MTRDEAREAAKVLQHYADGGDVQYRDSHGWCDASTPCFDFHDTKYRIKPKPAEGWGTVSYDNDPNTLTGWPSEKDALSMAGSDLRVIHWREVTE